MAEIHDPIQEQLVAARRTQILDAATKVFAEKGFQRSTVRDVAKQAGIADGTIYLYFENKSALILGILDRLNETERRSEDLGRIAEADFRQFMLAYLQRRYQVFAEQGFDSLRAVLPEILSNPEVREQYMQQIIEPTYKISEQHLAAMIGEGKVRPLDVALMSRVLSATTFGLLTLWVLGDPVVRDRWDEIAEIVTAITLDGIAIRDDDQA
jgi:TetR/AcrR family fatty acid metabolism transcriptional regulator